MSASAELLKKVKRIEIKSRGLSNRIFSGEYHSAFKGRGMAFSEVREYQPGDEIRSIDWNVTARFNHPYVKVFEEERELTVLLAIDISSSGKFGTRSKLKSEMIIEICAVIAFSAINNNDKIGVVLFSDQIEKFIPPKKGKSHALRIIKELLEFKPVSEKTSIKTGLEYIRHITKKKAIVFLISDMMDEGFDKSLKIVNRRHDLVALQIADPSDTRLPNVGLVNIIDPETKQTRVLDTSDPYVRKTWEANRMSSLAKTIAKFRSCGTDHLILETDRDYIPALSGLFKRRGGRR